MHQAVADILFSPSWCHCLSPPRPATAEATPLTVAGWLSPTGFHYRKLEHDAMDEEYYSSG